MPQIPFVSRSFFFKGQLVHLLLLTAILLGAVALIDFNQLAERRLFGVSAQAWLALALGLPIVHQIYVWLAWRSELCFGVVTSRLGSNAFISYQVVFMALLLARPVSLTLLTLATHDSIKAPAFVRIPICVFLAIPAFYTFYSVARYFGMDRAAGIDHFDERYRSKPLVKQGIFKYTSNSMYSFGFLVLWIIAIAGASWPAIVVAAFSHAYIWVHYFCTERPDMQFIYAPEASSENP